MQDCKHWNPASSDWEVYSYMVKQVLAVLGTKPEKNKRWVNFCLGKPSDKGKPKKFVEICWNYYSNDSCSDQLNETCYIWLIKLLGPMKESFRIIFRWNSVFFLPAQLIPLRVSIHFKSQEWTQKPWRMKKRKPCFPVVFHRAFMSLDTIMRLHKSLWPTLGHCLWPQSLTFRSPSSWNHSTSRFSTFTNGSWENFARKCSQPRGGGWRQSHEADCHLGEMGETPRCLKTSRTFGCLAYE